VHEVEFAIKELLDALSKVDIEELEKIYRELAELYVACAHLNEITIPIKQESKKENFGGYGKRTKDKWKKLVDKWYSQLTTCADPGKWEQALKYAAAEKRYPAFESNALPIYEKTVIVNNLVVRISLSSKYVRIRTELPPEDLDRLRKEFEKLHLSREIADKLLVIERSCRYVENFADVVRAINEFLGEINALNEELTKKLHELRSRAAKYLVAQKI